MDLNTIYNENCISGLSKINKETIDLVITSPPINNNTKYDNYEDDLSYSDYMLFNRKWLNEIYRILKDDGKIVLNIPYEVNYKERGGKILLVSEFYRMMNNLNFKYSCIIDLNQQVPFNFKYNTNGNLSQNDSPYIYNPKECLLMFYKNQWKKELKNEIDNGTIKYNNTFKKYTPSNFSIDIPEKSIKILTFENDVVLDPFMGSGTTAIACIKLNRNYIGFEISKKYCEIANERIDDYKNNQININLDLFKI